MPLLTADLLCCRPTFSANAIMWRHQLSSTMEPREFGNSFDGVDVSVHSYAFNLFSPLWLHLRVLNLKVGHSLWFSSPRNDTIILIKVKFDTEEHVTGTRSSDYGMWVQIYPPNFSLSGEGCVVWKTSEFEVCDAWMSYRFCNSAAYPQL